MIQRIWPEYVAIAYVEIIRYVAGAVGPIFLDYHAHLNIFNMD